MSFELVALPLAPKHLPVAALILTLAADEAALGRVKQIVNLLTRPVLGFQNQTIVSFLRANASEEANKRAARPSTHQSRDGLAKHL